MVAVRVGVKVEVWAGEEVAVKVGVKLGVGVKVRVMVKVGVRVGVEVGVGVRVFVEVGVTVGVQVPPLPGGRPDSGSSLPPDFTSCTSTPLEYRAK